ncbi:Imm1 family immunity protein [Plantactinospora solaniradicis]|uniref:Imm1 family immunity protein n=1 Tax=Plantactinospora solaniradicis TaxID=1723736 RepID=A0ABW1K3L5_9ACTN
MVAMVWGRGSWRTVDGIAELDAVLADLAAISARPQVVGLYPPRFLEPDFSLDELLGLPSLQLGIGHPARGFLLWLGPGHGLGYEVELPPWPSGVREIEFDHGGEPVYCGPYRAAVTPAAVRDAALEYAATGARPGRVLWRDDSAAEQHSVD